MVHPSGIGVTVMTHNGTAAGGEFDERRVGLDHLAFRVADQTELERWVTRLDDKGVTHSGIIDIGFGPTVVFRDLDNIQLEFDVHAECSRRATQRGGFRGGASSVGRGSSNRRTGLKPKLKS